MGIKMFGDLFLHPFVTTSHCSVMAIGALEPTITILQKNGCNSEIFHEQATKKHRGMPHALIVGKIPNSYVNGCYRCSWQKHLIYCTE